MEQPMRYRPSTLALVIAVASACAAAPSAFAATPASDGNAACSPRAAADATWDGIGVLQGGKGYTETPMGQVHYRLIGPADGPTIVLLHQTPWNMIQFADIQACLAAEGIRSLAIDTPGYGLSDVPEGKPTIAAYADNIVPVLDALGIRKAVFAGHHTGAAIAASFTARHSERSAGMVLHGAPNYNDAERAQRRALPHPDLSLKSDGSHLGGYFSRLYSAQGSEPRHLATITWSTLNIYLAGKADVAHAAVYDNDMKADLLAARVPALVLSDAKDALHEIDQKTAALKPEFRYQRFSEGSPHAMMVEPKRWAQTVAPFVKEATQKAH